MGIKLFRLVRFGVSGNDTKSEARRVVLTNQLAIVFAAVAFPYIFIFYALGLSLLSLSVIPFVVGFLVAIPLNAMRRHRLAKLDLIIVANLALVFYSTVLGDQSGINYIFFALVVIPFVFYTPAERLEMWVGFLTPIGLMLLRAWLGYLHGAGFYVVPPDHLLIIRMTTTIVTFIMLIMSIRFYYWATYRTEKSLELALSDLTLVNLQLTESNQHLSDALGDLKRSNSVIQSLSQAATLGAIMRGIVHEVKTPLTSIRAISSLLLLDPGLSPDVREGVSKIVDQTRHLGELTKTLLADNGSIAWNDAPINLKRIIDQTLRLVENEGFVRKIHFEKRIPEDLPLLRGGGAYISQALINLLVNAIRFSPDNSAITVSVDCDSKWVIVYIKDNGPGVPAELRDVIFQEGVTTSLPGDSHVGLGLYFVQRVMDAHQGFVKIHDTSEYGTTFALGLPISEVPKR